MLKRYQRPKKAPVVSVSSIPSFSSAGADEASAAVVSASADASSAM